MRSGESTSAAGARSARTRARFIAAAERLFAEHGVNGVSLSEITLAAGQKNRSALQYHFGNRDGLLQAIIDTHAEAVNALRRDYMNGPALRDCAPAKAAARGLIVPLARYIIARPAGAHYVKILSQLAATNSPLVNPATRSGINFQDEAQLHATMRAALSHLNREEAQRRLFVAISLSFHGLADVCRVHAAPDIAAALTERDALFKQLALAVETLLSAPAIEA
ncbi:MAG: TetR/AcrR family transcriptional regulator [Halioglobus sp.]|nr:TetR/AcrR family transcriptional regulator [Halioglobus sp.]